MYIHNKGNRKYRRATADVHDKDEIYRMIYENSQVFQKEEKKHINTF